MNRLLTLFAFLALSCGHIHAAEPTKPNVVFILADDLGWRDIGSFVSTFALKLRIKSTGSGSGVVYFTDMPQGGFNNKQLVTFPLKHDGEFHDYEVKIPATRLTALRLDPGNAPGAITVALMELRDVNHNRLRNLAGDVDDRGERKRTEKTDEGSRDGKEDRLMLDNGRIKVGIDRSKGASGEKMEQPNSP